MVEADSKRDFLEAYLVKQFTVKNEKREDFELNKDFFTHMIELVQDPIETYKACFDIIMDNVDIDDSIVTENENDVLSEE